MEERRARFPVIDRRYCSRCQGCVDSVPEVFFVDDSSGLVSVVDRPDYPPAVDEAIKNCPRDCISWESRGSGDGPKSTGEFTVEEILGIG